MDGAIPLSGSGPIATLRAQGGWHLCAQDATVALSLETSLTEQRRFDLRARFGVAFQF